MLRCSFHSPAVRAAERLTAGNNRPYGASKGAIEPLSLLFCDMEALLFGQTCGDDPTSMLGVGPTSPEKYLVLFPTKNNKTKKQHLET